MDGLRSLRSGLRGRLRSGLGDRLRGCLGKVLLLLLRSLTSTLHNETDDHEEQTYHQHDDTDGEERVILLHLAMSLRQTPLSHAILKYTATSHLAIIAIRTSVCSITVHTSLRILFSHRTSRLSDLNKEVSRSSLRR